MNFKNEKIAWIALIIIVFLGLFMQYKSFGYTFKHEYPVAIHSADANSRVSETEGIIVSGQSYFQPVWFDDNKTHIIENDPPIAMTTAAMIAKTSGLPAYDSIFLVAVISSIGVAVVCFILFWKFFDNTLLGLIAAGLLIYPLEKAYHYQIEIGMYPHFTQLMFLALMMIFIMKYLSDASKRHEQNASDSAPMWISAIGVGVMFGFAFLSHSPNAILLMVCAHLIFAYQFWKKSIPFKQIAAHVALMDGVAMIIIFAYLPVLMVNYFGWGMPTHDSAFVLSAPFANANPSHPIQLATLVHPVLYVLLLLGLVGGLLWTKSEKYKTLIGIFSFMVCITIILSYFGVYHPHATDKSRYMLYVFAYPVIAIGIYMAVQFLNQIFKNQALKKTIDSSIALAIIAIAIIAFQAYTMQGLPADTGSILTKDAYDGYVWAQTNVPAQQRILCIGCVQFEGVYTRHPTYLASYEVDQSVFPQLLDIAQNNQTTGIVKSHSMGHSDFRLYWDGFNIATYGLKLDMNRSICEFDYVIFKELGQATPIISAIAYKMIGKNNTVVYDNQKNFIIVQNTHKRGAENTADGACI